MTDRKKTPEERQERDYFNPQEMARAYERQLNRNIEYHGGGVDLSGVMEALIAREMYK